MKSIPKETLAGPVPIVAGSATALAYAQMQDLLATGCSGCEKGKRIRYPIDPDQGIRLRTGDRIRNTAFKGGNRMILSGPYNFDTAGRVVRSEILTNVELVGCRKNGWGKTLWGINAYEVTGRFMQEDCLTDKIGIYPEPTNGGRVEGHGDYLHLIAGAEPIWRRCTFKQLMGNAIQCVRRAGESAIEPVPDYASPQGIARIHDCHIEDVSLGKERGSFAIAWYAPGASLEIVDTYIMWRKGIPKGGVIVGDPQSYVVRGEAEQRTKTVAFSRLVLDNRYGYHPGHPAVQLQGVDETRGDVANLRGGAMKFVYDQDCGSINVDLYGDWEIVKRNLKPKLPRRETPLERGWDFEVVKTITGKGRFVR